MRCLIIDDDPDDQEIFEMCVRNVKSDVDFLALSSGVDAVVLLRSDDKYVPDYIFLDVNMPKMNGIDCLRELKQIKRLEHTKIFIYSTTTDKKVAAHSKELGANDYIVKPASTTELKNKLHTIFSIVSGIA
jgi:DNA-binding response OmpR family regulator